MDFLESQKVLHPDLTEHYNAFRELFEKKLWHQLSLALEKFILNKDHHRGETISNLYTFFISGFEARLNQVKLAQLISIVASTLASPTASLGFVNGILKSSRTRLGADAALCLDMDVVVYKLKVGEAEEAKSMLDEAKTKLLSISSSEAVIFSKVYGATFEYRKLVGPPTEFYNAALMFLAYTSVDDLSSEYKYTLATDMCLASIAGDDIFNFGEVLATPILAALVNTPNQWMYDLVLSLNFGDVDKFNKIIDAHKLEYNSQPVLLSKHETIKQKVALLSLVNLAFERPSHDRQISFADVAARTRIPVNQVEWLMMRAMSLGLLKGIIDEVNYNFCVSWVQPRVLDKDQLLAVQGQVEAWSEKVKKSLVLIEDRSLELYV